MGTFNAIDLFSGCGGLSVGLQDAGFNVIAGVEIDKTAAEAYRLNHKDSVMFEENIRNLDTNKIKELLNNEPLHFLAGCPPCQGFSSVRRLNKMTPAEDERNNLILEYYRVIEELMPLTIMMENVPGLINYELFKEVIEKLKALDYKIDYQVVSVHKYGVPQRRRRLVVVGSLLDEIKIAEGSNEKLTVRNMIGNIKDKIPKNDPVHKIIAGHTPRIQEMITKIPKNGGSRKDLPPEYELECHKKPNVGFNDIYGRLRWDDYSTTMTGGCLNPSKGRFLHPEEDRCISAREAAMLQTFPADYHFPANISKTKIALLIGNALPPKFSEAQSRNVYKHLEAHLSNAG